MTSNLVKLTSINCWAGDLGIMPCDEGGMPILEESKSWDSITPEWFAQLSAEDKEIASQLIVYHRSGLKEIENKNK